MLGDDQKEALDRNEDDTYDIHVHCRWSENRVHEMTHKDWHILQEDFSISFKGAYILHPMSNWEEAGLSQELLQLVQKVGNREDT